MADPNEKKAESTEQARKREAQRQAEIHRDPKTIERDNVEFIKALEDLSKTEKKAEKQKIIEAAEQWSQKGDLDLLRAAGLTLDQIKKNPLERHIRLAAAFLKREKVAGLTFRVDFNNNELAQINCDLSDLLPANVLAVDILDDQGKVLFLNAKRTVREGRPCYVSAAKPPEPEKIAFIRTGFRIKVTETATLNSGAAGIKKMEEELYLTENARKTALKEQVRQQAQQQGQEVITDQNFFDVILRDFLKVMDNLGQKGEFNLAAFTSSLSALINKIGFKIDPRNKAFERQQASTPPPQPVPARNYPKGDEEKAPAPVKEEEKRAQIDTPSDQKLVDTARRYVGNTGFRGPEVRGGNLACAQVASTILKEAGVIDRVYLGVGLVENQLLKKGWYKHNAPATAGDVVIWGPLPPKIDSDGLTQKGKGHIGIMTTEILSVNNNSSRKMPVESKVNFNSSRGVYFLSPPHRKQRGYV